MANTAKTSSKLAALIKKTAQKLVKNPKAIHKELKKLALTLPLMALLVEEVRAAQKKTSIDAAPAPVFEDETALAEFIEAQNLDEAQYAEIEQELEGVLLAQADQAKQEDDDDKGALLERSETGAGRGLAAEAESEAATTAAEHAAAETESFELAGLVIPIAPAPFIGAVAGGLGLVAVANTAAGGGVNTETATSDTLGKSLKQLVAEGVNFVQPVAGSDTLNIRFGSESALASTAGVPLVGDTNQDGSLSTGEKALNVNLIIENAEQLAELAALPGLANFGIDSVTINLATQNLLNALVSDTTLAADLAAIRATGLTINTIDMGAAVSINEAQAATLVSSGIDLHFAAADDITLQAPAGSTHLNTSLKDLQKLGVDTVTVTGAAAGADLHVNLGNGAAIDTANGALPSFGADSALNVTLDVNSLSQLAEVATLAGAADVNLAERGLDSVELNLAGQTELNALLAANVGSNSSLDQSLSAVRNDGLSITTIDMGSTTAVHLTDLQASALLQDGLNFAANDMIEVQAAAGSTHLSTSLKDLQKLGVDTVSVTGAAAGADLHVTLGNGAAIDTANGALPSFGADSALNVTLDVNSLSQLAEVATLAGAADVNLAERGLDSVELNLAGQTELNALLAANVGSNSSLDQSLSAVRNEGLSVTTIDVGTTAAVHLTDLQASGLVLDGLHFAANDMIELQAAAGSTHLSTSLKDLQKLGVDMVTVTGAAAGADLSLALGNGAAIDLASGALPSFGVDGALNVTLDVNSAAQLAEVATLAGAADVNLAERGLDNVELNLAGQTELNALLAANVGSNSSLDQSLSAVRNDDLSVTTIDMGSTATVHLTDLQASALLQDGLHFAANDMIEVQAAAGSTHLSTSLKDLQKLGVDMVTVTGAAAGADLHVALGEGAAINFTNGLLPSFGADSALNVTLDVTNASQLAEVATLASDINKLGQAGIDQIDMASNEANISQAQAQALVNADVKFVDSDSVTMNIALDTDDLSLDATKAASLQNAGVDHFNVDAPAVINEAFADLMLGHHLDFASANDITLNVIGTHMGTSLADLQKLGVDHVSMSISSDPDFNYALNNALTLQSQGVDLIDITTDLASINYVAAKALADANIQFSAEDDITLEITADAAGDADFVDAMQQAQTLQNLGVDHLDFLSDGVWLNGAGATSLIDASIDFAAEDDVTLRGTNSSYLAQNAVELSKLGVDHVQITTEETDFDEISTVAQTLHDAGLATFDMDIYASTLETLTTLQTLESIQNNGVDFNVHLELSSDIGGFNNINNLAFGSLQADATFGQLTQALQEAGIHDYIVDGFNTPTNAIAIPDALVAALQEAGMLHALPDANMALDASNNGTFSTTHQAINTSLAAMAELGIDSVDSAANVDKLFVSLGDNADVATIVAGFTNGSQAPDNGGLFGAGKEAGLVMDQTTFNQFNVGDISELLSNLFSLGFTEIDVLNEENDYESYQITAQTEMLDTTNVQLLGVNDANALLDVFGTDILGKKIS